ncbi:MAG: DUF1854 domain-containing protein [Clostridia bacterium]|nr:DUF1854 domain-containing protein [Clostridia bacterium]
MNKTQNNEQQTISPDTLKAEYLSPDSCRFFRTEKGFLGAVINGTEYKRVVLARALPLSFPDDYVCISDIDKKELGIIEHISDFSEENQKLINEELSQRYFSPVITEILSIREKFGNFYFDVMLGDLKRNFTVKDLTKNIRYHEKGFDLIDVDGNRYRILDFDSIPKKSRRKLEPYLY